MRISSVPGLAGSTAILFTLVLSLSTQAGSRSSANYHSPMENLDNGGRPAGSARYANQGAIGGVAGNSSAAALPQVVRHGYVGQIYEVTGLALSANPTNVNEGDARQLQALATLDDNTTVIPAGPLLRWRVGSGPLSSINANGLATAGSVYQDTLASAQATFLSASGSIGLRVVNVGEDNYGSYAGDGLDDAWQVQSFGENHPQAGPAFDPDNDGQNNRYEHLVGSGPNDGSSFFRFRIEAVAGQPDWKNLVFSPRVAGRTYTVESKTDWNGPGFVELVPITVSDSGSERTVTDLNATGTNKVYRVRISMP